MPRSPAPAHSSDPIVARAYDYASSYDLRLVRDALTREPGARVMGPNPLVIQFAPRTMLVVFDYGTAVFFNIADEECARYLDVLKPCAQRPNRTVARDDFTLFFAPRGKEPEGTETLTVKEFNRDVAIVVAIVLSRSVALEYYEAIVSGSLERLEGTVSTLASQGRIPRGQKELTRIVGEAMLVEHELAHSVSAFDEPEVVWEGGTRIAQLYAGLKREFDLDDRIKVIQQKVSLISRWSTFVISRLEGHRSRVLEWLIIILILSEILLVLFGKM